MNNYNSIAGSHQPNPSANTGGNPNPANQDPNKFSNKCQNPLPRNLGRAPTGPLPLVGGRVMLTHPIFRPM